MPTDTDLEIRAAAVRRCQHLRATWGEAVPARELTRGFLFRDQKISLVAWGRGIFKPQQLSDGPLTLVSSLASTYADEHLDGERMRYDYAAQPSEAWANEGLKRVASLGRAVILLKQVKPKPNPEYMVFAPVSILGCDDARRTFDLALGEQRSLGMSAPIAEDAPFHVAGPRARIRHAHFRRAVLAAYKDRCCICRLRERVLLDAAHIVSAPDPGCVPTVADGLSMCPTHRRAYRRDILALDDEYNVHVLRERLDHVNDLATVRALIDFDGQPAWLPKAEDQKPDRALLRERLSRIVAA